MMEKSFVGFWIMLKDRVLFAVYSVIYSWEVGYRKENKCFDQKVLVNVTVLIVVEIEY